MRLLNWMSVPLVSGLVILGAAGSFSLAACIFLLNLSVSTALITVYLYLRVPKLLERRKSPLAESDLSQRLIKGLIFMLFALTLYVGAAPIATFSLQSVIIGNSIMLLGLYLRFLVFRENAYASAAITFEENQPVIATGPYSVIRHPMYLSTLLILAGAPLALGSTRGLQILPVLCVAIACRAIAEERLLSRALHGYNQYCEAVQYRLVPYVW